MYGSIRTTKTNKELVTRLTNKLGLGAENVIARIALSYSLATGEQLDLKLIGDNNGKEYAFRVLFGEYAELYVAMVACHYRLYKTDKDIVRYIKMHIDHGLLLINSDIEKKYSLSGTDFLINEIEKGMLNL
jgi:DNA sulfur modification protein DndE